MEPNEAQKTESTFFETLEKIFFGLFLFSTPLQTRITFATHETYRYGFFNEYATFFLYLSDILFIITLFLFFVNYLTKRVNYGKILKTKLSTYPLLIPLLALFLLIAWGFLSIYWSAYKEISFYKSLKFIEFGLLFFYITQRLRWFGLTKLLSIIFVAGFFQSVISILQYLYQHSLGLKLLGESVLAPNIDNVAKIVVDGEKIIRAYGTFPHPNVFAGFLILSIFSGFLLLLTTKTGENFLSRISILAIGITLQLATFILTFSRVAWVGGAITIIVIIFIITHKLFHVKQFVKNGLNKPKFISFLIVLTSFLVFLALNRNSIISRGIDTTQNYQQAIGYRILYNDIAIKMIKGRSITGIGNGNFTLKMVDYSPTTLEWWQYQPAHNIYLLITSELGVIGLILFLFFIFSTLKRAYLKQEENYGFHPPTFLLKLFHVKQLPNYTLNKPKNLPDEEISAGRRETILLNRLILAIFIGFLFIGLFDHYFWTLQQGQLTLWLVLGVLMASVKPRQGE